MKPDALTTVLKTFFDEEQITLFGVLPLTECPVIRQDLLARSLPGAQTVILYAVPYFTTENFRRNVSLYALAPDYHIYMSDLGKRLRALLSSACPGASFASFADHSPINERISAAKAGLGVLGDNFLLITREYGSYIFIGELLTDLPPEKLGAQEPVVPGECLHCGQCKNACPCHFENCASGIGQKKGELTPEEEDLVLKTGLVWGCDLCQTSCPLNRDVKKTPIAFFQQDLLFSLDKKIIENMGNESFRKRAYAWRGRKTVLRNIELFEKKGRH